MAKIDIDKLSLTVIAELKLFSRVTTEIVEKAVVETAKETVNELRITSPEGDTGEYKKSWKYKRDSEAKGKNKYNMIVYSKKPNYRLTHLLENGHAKVNGGRTKPIPHIKNAEETAKKRLENKIIRGIQEAGR